MTVLGLANCAKCASAMYIKLDTGDSRRAAYYYCERCERPDAPPPPKSISDDEARLWDRVVAKVVYEGGIEVALEYADALLEARRKRFGRR